MTFEEICGHLKARIIRQGQAMALCPNHQDKNPSLSITEALGGRTLLHCFGNCKTADVLHAANLEWVDLFSKPRASKRRYR